MSKKFTKRIRSIIWMCLTIICLTKSVQAQPGLSFIHQDHLGSASLTTDAQGNSPQKRTYYPFGAVEMETIVGHEPNAYNDKELDSKTKLYNFEARMYAAHRMHFTTPDTIIPILKNPQDFNRYAYVRNNPMKYTDPTGHSPHNDQIQVTAKNLNPLENRKDFDSWLSLQADVIERWEPEIAKILRTTPTTVNKKKIRAVQNAYFKESQGLGPDFKGTVLFPGLLSGKLDVSEPTVLLDLSKFDNLVDLMGTAVHEARHVIDIENFKGFHNVLKPESTSYAVEAKTLAALNNAGVEFDSQLIQDALKESYKELVRERARLVDYENEGKITPDDRKSANAYLDKTVVPILNQFIDDGYDLQPMTLNNVSYGLDGYPLLEDY